jgi:hypothetical protein
MKASPPDRVNGAEPAPGTLWVRVTGPDRAKEVLDAEPA